MKHFESYRDLNKLIADVNYAFISFKAKHPTCQYNVMRDERTGATHLIRVSHRGARVFSSKPNLNEELLGYPEVGLVLCKLKAMGFSETPKCLLDYRWVKAETLVRGEYFSVNGVCYQRTSTTEEDVFSTTIKAEELYTYVKTEINKEYFVEVE